MNKNTLASLIASYPRQSTCWNMSIYEDHNYLLKRVVYVAKFFSLCQIGTNYIGCLRNARLSAWGAQFKVPIEPLNIIALWCFSGLRGALNYPPWCRETTASRATDCCWFASLSLHSLACVYAYKRLLCRTLIASRNYWDSHGVFTQANSALDLRLGIPLSYNTDRNRTKLSYVILTNELLRFTSVFT